MASDLELKNRIKAAMDGLDPHVHDAIKTDDEMYHRGVHENWGGRAMDCYDVLLEIYKLVK